jgi:hypothetical protein
VANGAIYVELAQETLEAFAAYVREAENLTGQARAAGDSYLWSDADPERQRRVAAGEVLAQVWSGEEPVKVPHGLIHDWVGAVFVPGAAVDAAIAMVQDYDHHKDIYRPDVIDSRLVSRRENDFKIYMRLLKKKIITVVLDTDHDVRYTRVDSKLWVCRSYTTRIAEVDNAGTASEIVQRPDAGMGVLWRLNSYWTFQEREAGVTVECRAISLTRDIPAGLRWVVRPIIRNLPKESLVNTLSATRQALLARLEAVL